MTIKDIRVRRKMSQMELAKKAMITQAYLSQLENGKKANPSLKTLSRLASALSVPVQELLIYGEEKLNAG